MLAMRQIVEESVVLKRRLAPFFFCYCFAKNVGLLVPVGRVRKLFSLSFSSSVAADGRMQGNGLDGEYVGYVRDAVEMVV